MYSIFTDYTLRGLEGGGSSGKGYDVWGGGGRRIKSRSRIDIKVFNETCQ